MEDVAVIATAIVVFAVGLLGARGVARRFLIERARRVDQLEHRGIVHGSDMVLRIALIFVWGGIAIGSLSMLPLVAWVATGDGEAGAVAIRILLVGLMIAAAGALGAVPGLKLIVLEPGQLTSVGPFRERSLALSEVNRLDEARIIPALLVRSPTGRIRVARSTAGFDDFFNRLVAGVGSDVLHDARSPNPQVFGASEPGEDGGGHYAVGRVRLGLNLGFLLVALVFFLAWPWFLVEGEHPTRDSFIFMGIGLVLWLGLAFLVGNETLQRGQPIELDLRPASIAWRTLRGGWQERPQTDLVSASVETHIIYVKGQPGHRYPLRLRFVDEEVLEIDDFRGRHLGSSTQLIGVDVRRRYLHVGGRSSQDRRDADEAFRRAVELEASGSPIEAVGWYRRAIASWPDPTRLPLYCHIGDLLREHGSSPEHVAASIAHYRAHVDLYPSDAHAWQALGACLSGGLRSDLADEAIAIAEQLLLSGRAESPSGPPLLDV